MWFGMNSGSDHAQSRSFRDCKAIFERAEMVLLDHQARSTHGFEAERRHRQVGTRPAWAGTNLRQRAWRCTRRDTARFRVASKPAAEARHVDVRRHRGRHSAVVASRSAPITKTAACITRPSRIPLARDHEQYLVNRRPLATVGVVWSQTQHRFLRPGRAADLVDAPYRGFTEALLKARIPYIPVNADHIDRDAGALAVLVLPNVGALSDQQCAAIRRFVERGGALIATGASSRYNEWGDPRPDFALADLFGAHASAKDGGRKAAGRTLHTYLRLAPELRGQVRGPKAGDEPAPSGERHAVLKGFEETDILPFGGTLEAMRIEPDAIVPLTFIPPFPIYPPETSWMRQPKTNIPAVVLRDRGEARVAYLAADLDRRYGRDNLPDHGRLLANIVRWAAGDRIPLEVRGPGLIDCQLYRQPGRLILHLVNLTNAGTCARRSMN